MIVTVEKNLMDYLHEHHHDIIKLELIHEDYSLGNIYSKMPHISYHKPPNPEYYDKYTVDDITVYVEKGISAKNDQLDFIFEKMLGKRACHVHGIVLDEYPKH
ncbi:MAG: hypothetical protein JW702_08770 [Clostridiales bacterium]|nr:hypothetical protein [Clostridiales bacterium]